MKIILLFNLIAAEYIKIFSGSACFPPRWCKLLVGHPLKDVQVDHFSYPTCTCSRWGLPVPVPDPCRRFLPKITLGCVTPTIPHLARATDLLYLYLVGLMVIVQVSHGYRYTRGSIGSCRELTLATQPTGIPVPVAYPYFG